MSVGVCACVSLSVGISLCACVCIAGTTAAEFCLRSNVVLFRRGF